MKKAVNLCERIIEVLEFGMLSAIVLLIGGQIISRALFNLPLKFPEEVCMFLMIALVFCGVIVVEKEDAHLKVEFILGKLSPRGRKIVALLGKALTVVLVCAILSSERQLFPNVAPLRSTAAGIPYIWVHSVIAVSCVIWIWMLAYTAMTTAKREG